MENGLTTSDRRALGVHQNKAYAMYDSSHAPPRTPTTIQYQNTYSISEYPHPGRPSYES